MYLNNYGNAIFACNQQAKAIALPIPALNYELSICYSLRFNNVGLPRTDVRLWRRKLPRSIWISTSAFLSNL